jgi:hopene-associated glycosyltransferase HpnB
VLSRRGLIKLTWPRLLGVIHALIWVYLGGFRGAFWRLRERLPKHDAPGIPLTVIIPARNEEASIGLAVTSLRAQQTAAPLRIVVADDESADRTAETAWEAGADLVLPVLPRPANWTGKVWALAEAIRGEAEAIGNETQNQTRTPEYFLLTDADIEYASPVIISSLLAKAAEGYDLVSVMVRLRCESWAEKLFVPAFVFFFFKLYPPAWVASGKNVAAAAGGCMLIRSEALRRIGGLASIRNAVIDDCALARQVKSAGGTVWLGVSDAEIRSIRPYPSSGDMRAMIARSAFAQLRHSTLLLAGTALGMTITYLAPVVLISSGDRIALALGLIGWIASAALFFPTVRMYRAPPWTTFCLPFIGAFYLAATVESALRYWSGRGVEWKGRVRS